MRHARRAPHIPLSEVRLSHLMTGGRRAAADKCVTVRIPVPTLDGVRHLAESVGATYAEAVIALLNEGLEAAKRRNLL